MGIMDYEEEVHESSWGSSTVFFPVNRDQSSNKPRTNSRLAPIQTGPLNYVGGFYYLEADSYITSGPIQPFTVNHEAEAQALYGELTYDFNEQWSLTLGRVTLKRTRTCKRILGHRGRRCRSHCW
ncbi:MAG: hypothetical protein CM15mP25_5030 [Gammaproteobacteria bacterium]|nr:MAG: hypothetical protein CM15mP25_5030 [Gammaproteobacteria bacterium]